MTNFLKAGGRRLDTSLKWYNDIDGVSAAIKDSPVPRSEVFVTGKVETPCEWGMVGMVSASTHAHCAQENTLLTP